MWSLLERLVPHRDRRPFGFEALAQTTLSDGTIDGPLARVAAAADRLTVDYSGTDAAT